MISLNYRESGPLYEQIKDEFRKLMVKGALGAGDKLPSVREISTELAINPNTVQRAYRELEAEGYIYSIAGKGSFVSDRSDVEDKRKRDLLVQFDNAASELKFLGVSEEELVSRIKGEEEH